MQNIKLTIFGEFWDSQIYSKNLYIFGDSGDMYIVDWDNLINHYFDNQPDLQTVAHISFLESDLLYTKSAQVILKSPVIASHLKDKFIDLSTHNISLQLDKSTSRFYKHKDNPLPFPHADSEVYYSKLYVALNEGVFATPCYSSNADAKHLKLWDAPVFGISASNSYTAIALSAGSDGLFEMSAEKNNHNILSKPTLVSDKHCSSCDWSFYNINATSHIYSSFFAAYKKIPDSKNKRKFHRQLDKIIPTEEIFHATGYSWGSHDKMYMYNNGIIESIQYSANRDGTPSFRKIGSLPLQNWKGSVISASVAPFGTVVECENAIIVIRSDGRVITLPGEPVNWRIFSNSKYYKNQLHIIYDDRLEIHSFYHDYFVEQDVKTKQSGISMSQGNG
ncbi:MAG: hypothetical protein WC504_13170 [Methylobacter sp.]